jgi:hypothetical protein
LAGVCAVAVGDEAQKSQDKPVSSASATSRQILKIFPLKNMRANDALAVVRDIYRDLMGPQGSDAGDRLRFAVDERQNCIIASGNEQTLRNVEALIQRLDEHETVAVPKISVNFDLRYIDPHEAEAGVHQLGIEGVRTVVNQRTKALIANGTQGAIDRVRKLVVSLDVPPLEPRGENVAVRVVWLVDKSLATEKTPPVPGDLDSAIAALRKKMEIGELRTATQMMVNVDPVESPQFEVSGTASLLRSANLQLTGSIEGAKSNRLKLEFSASDSQGGKTICRLNTTTGSLIPGNPVIVGMTTMDSHPSLVVIELLPK